MRALPPAAVIALSGHEARAQLIDGRGSWYIGAEGGSTDLPDASINSAGTIGSAVCDDGYNVGARGSMMGPWRVEDEFSYRHNSLSSPSVTSPIWPTFKPASRDRDRYSEMFDVIHVFDFRRPFTATYRRRRCRTGVADQSHPAPALPLHRTETVFASQSIAGIRWITGPHIAIDLDYRNVGTSDLTFNETGGVTTKTSYGTGNFIAGVSHVFNTMPAPRRPPRRCSSSSSTGIRSVVTPEGNTISQHRPTPISRSGTAASCRLYRPFHLAGLQPAAVRAAYEQCGEDFGGAVVPKNVLIVSGRGEEPGADGAGRAGVGDRRIGPVAP